jgi:hypothetical protein
MCRWLAGATTRAFHVSTLRLVVRAGKEGLLPFAPDPAA